MPEITSYRGTPPVYVKTSFFKKPRVVPEVVKYVGGPDDKPLVVAVPEAPKEYIHPDEEIEVEEVEDVKLTDEPTVE